jgi:glycerol-3-phosphate dehydrogenase
MDDRRRELRDAAARRFDLIVVGGGINGAGIARAAAVRGYAVLLLDKQDWSFGTTWRSTKLIHGGLRYLEHGEFGLVFESLRDRAGLLRAAPHLVRPVPFLLPVYAGGRPMSLLRLGLTLYDLLALGGGLPRHKSLSPDEALAAEPCLRRDGLRGALGYWDAQVELPERLCLENVLRAREAGAATFTYLHVERVLSARRRVEGVAATDTLAGGTYEFRAPVVVNAAGPWVDDVLQAAGIAERRIGGTRGAHLVVDFPNGGPRRPIYAEAAADRRPFFVLPWRGAHLVSTTDVRVADPAATQPSDAEVEYLIEATQAVVPGDRIGAEHVRYAYGGIRPLPLTTDGAEGAITRRHHIVDHAGAGLAGFYSIVGGKLSTYLSLADQVIGRLAPSDGPARATEVSRLVPGNWRPDFADGEQVRLWRIYGPRAEQVLRGQREPCGSTPLCPHVLETVAQARRAIEHEGAQTVGDVLLRRTPAGWSACLGLDAAPRVADLLAGYRNWTDQEQRAAVDAYQGEVRATFRPIARSAALVSLPS